MTGVHERVWTWCATLAWRGDAYVGWQVQPNGPTIQDAVQKAVGRLCGLEHSIQVTATGRTDAGVHAEMQVVGFQIPVERTAHQVGLRDFGAHEVPPRVQHAAATAGLECTGGQQRLGRAHMMRWLSRGCRRDVREAQRGVRVAQEHSGGHVLARIAR